MAWKNHTIEEIILNVKEGELPEERDTERLIKYLEELKQWRKFGYAMDEARKHLPQ